MTTRIFNTHEVEVKDAIDTAEHHDVAPQQLRTDEIGFVDDQTQLGRRYFTSKFFIGSFAACAMALLSGVSAFAYAAPILNVINADIGPNPNYIWVSYAYNTCMAVTFPVLGRISDTFGRRYFFIGGALLAIVGCIVFSRAQDIPTLIGGNVFLGISSGTQLSYHFVLDLVLCRARRPRVPMADGVA